MDGIMESMGRMLGMGIFGLLVLVVLVLAIAALVKYLMSGEMRRLLAGFAILAALALTGAGFWVGFGRSDSASDVSAGTITLGRSLYAQHCASCHGANLEGQPDWRKRLPNGRMPAPPHDASGHTWHHSDDALFRVTREGSAVVAGGGYESDMPGFGDVMTDDQIRAVLAFIKSNWPERLRKAQEQRGAAK